MMQVAQYLCRCACIYDSTDGIKDVSSPVRGHRKPTFQYQSVQTVESVNDIKQQSITKAPNSVPEVLHHNSSKTQSDTSIEPQLPPISLHIISSDESDSEQTSDASPHDIVFTHDKASTPLNVDDEDSWHIL